MKHLNLSVILAIFGEALILTGFLLLGGGPDARAHWLHFAVASVIYALWMWQVLIPWIDRRDKAGGAFGALGIRWSAILAYSALAIAFMVAYNLQYDNHHIRAFYTRASLALANDQQPDVKNLSFYVQLLTQLALIFILCVFLVLGKSAKEKVESVYAAEQKSSAGKENLKTAVGLLRQKLSVKNDFPGWILERVGKMEEEVRYLSPNNSAQAQALEDAFTDKLKKLENALDFGDIDRINTDEIIKECEVILTERRRFLN